MKTPQPDFLPIEEGLRLVTVSGDHAFALRWYQNPDIVRMLDKYEDNEYDLIGIEWMYRFLARVGEVYFIESEGLLIGDVAMSPDDFNIMIGLPEYRGRGIGKKVIERMKERARELGYSKIAVKEIYDFNLPSIACFTKCGFKRGGKTKDGHAYSFKVDS